MKKELEEFEKFQFTAHLQRAEDMLFDDAPMLAAYELGQCAGHLHAAIARRGDDLPPRQERHKKAIEELRKWYDEIIGECRQDDNAALAVAAYEAGEVEATANEMFPRRLHLLVRRWAEQERSVLAGVTPVHRAARERSEVDEPCDYVPPGFGAPMERKPGLAPLYAALETGEKIPMGSDDETRTNGAARRDKKGESAADDGDA